jgi:hypothetical protein
LSIHSPWDNVGLIIAPSQAGKIRGSVAIPNDVMGLDIERLVKITNSILVRSSYVLGVEK